MTSLSDGLGPQKDPNSGRTRVESGPAGTHRPTTRRGSAIVGPAGPGRRRRAQAGDVRRRRPNGRANIPQLLCPRCQELLHTGSRRAGERARRDAGYGAGCAGFRVSRRARAERSGDRDRYLHHRPMIFTTNKPLAAWGRVLHDADLAEALLDRVLERGRHLELRRRSYRTRHAPLDLTPASEPPSPEPARISGNQRPQFSEPTHVALEGRCNTSTTFVRPSRSRSFLSARWQGSSISIAGRCSLLTDCAAALRATGSEAERRRHRAGRRLPRRRGRCWLCDAQPAAL